MKAFNSLFKFLGFLGVALLFFLVCFAIGYVIVSPFFCLGFLISLYRMPEAVNFNVVLMIDMLASCFVGLVIYIIEIAQILKAVFPEKKDYTKI